MAEVHVTHSASSKARSRVAATAGFLTRFRDDERGVSAVIFGIMFSAILLAAALAVDITRAMAEKSRQQAALDAAVLAASHQLGLPGQDSDGPLVAQKFFAENLKHGSDAEIDNIHFDSTNGSVEATASSSLATTLLRVFGKNSIDVGAASKVVKGDSSVEVAMVLDNSGSMAGTYIESLKTAAKNLTGVVFAGAEGTDKVKVALVPFAASVKVGSAYRPASWIDGGALSSIHSENFSAAKSRFDLFDDLGVAWGGCVESRPGQYDTNDTLPSAGNGDTLFVPMFAPDEPDDTNASAAGYSSYVNNYISDYGGTCPAPAQICVVFNKKKNMCTQWAPETLPVATAQARTCKYAGAPIIDGTGPNYMCTTKPVVALTNSRSTVEAAIDGLVASGNTNIGEGTMWGWRLLSPSTPFTEGRSFGDHTNRKVMIIMTDGENTYSSASNHNSSRYGASGYASKGRLGTTYTSTAYVSAMNAKLALACSNAKAAGITIYTVAFRLESSPTTQEILTQCATSPDGYFAASDGSTLIQSFQTIGRDIAELRVAS